MNIRLIAQGSTKWQRFIKRWGVSFLVDGDILFDTFGDRKVLVKNIQKFGVDKQAIKHIVLSHEHWDHIDGLYEVTANRVDVVIYGLNDFSHGTHKYIKFSGAKVVNADMLINVKNNIFLSGKINGSYAGKNICEQALVVKSSAGLILLVGCSHPGIVEMVEIVNQRFGGKVCLVVGGLHLKDDTHAAVERIGYRLKELGVERIAPVHCTGQMAQGVLREMFGDNYICLKEGADINID